MKKIALAFLSMLIATPVFAGIYYTDGWKAILDKYVPTDKKDNVAAVLHEIYDNTLGVEYKDLWKLCAAAGWNIQLPQDEKQCQDFIYDLVHKDNGNMLSQTLNVCNEKTANNVRQKGGTPICVRDFTNEYIGGTQVRMSEAMQLAFSYATEKNGDKIGCSPEYRTIPVLGSIDYGVQCASLDDHKYYEFIFDDVTESDDPTIQDSIQRAVCTGIFGAKATVAGNVSGGHISGGPNMGAQIRYSDASCDANADLCNRISNVLNKFGYSAAYKTNDSTGQTSCFIDFHSIANKDELRTAYDIDNFEFCKNAVQVQNSPDVESMLKAFISQKSGKPVSQIECYAGTRKYTGDGCTTKPGNFSDDIKTCYVDGNFIDFVFDDLSEFSDTYIKGGKQAMSCVIAGGTYSGQRCLGLDENQCNLLKKANLQTCPECKSVRWDTETQSCVLPSSQDANNLKKGINISLIVGGTAVAVIVTIGTAGTGTAAVATVVLTGIETVGAGIEITSQLKIDGIADDFLIKSNQCNNASCAKNLINQHLQRLARLMDDMTDAEINAIDSEMARLIGLVPTTDDWWTKNLKSEDGTSFLASANDGKWEPEQVWRALGVGLQFAGTFAAVGKWILTKKGVMVRWLDKTSRILLKNAKIAKANVVKLSDLSGADVEWYKLWQEYAPKNQTFSEFKAMTDGNLDEMKQMSKNWTPRSAAQVQAKKQAQDRLYQLMDEYEIDSIPDNPEELAALYKKYPDLKIANEQLDKFDVDNYSTFDPKMSRDFRQYNKAQKELNDWFQTEYNKELDRFVQNGGARADFDNSDQVKILSAQYTQKNEAVQKLKPSQWEIADKYPLKNVDNVVNQRAREFKDIIADNPGIKSQMDHWDDLTDVERLSVAQQIIDAYSAKTGTPNINVFLDSNTPNQGSHSMFGIALNPNKERFKSADGMIDLLAHEHGHFIDAWVPNEGALGAQYSYYGARIYSGEIEDGYRVALSEQSSYKIGPATSKEVTGTTDPRFGTEYDLKHAEQKLKTAETAAAAAIGATPLAITGVTVVAKTPITQIIKDKLSPEEEQNDYKR